MPRRKTVIEESDVEEAEVEVIEAEPVEAVPWELQDFLSEALEKQFKIVYKVSRVEFGKEYHLKTYYNHCPDEDELYETFGHAYPKLELKIKVAYWDTVKKRRKETTRIINIDRSYLNKPMNGEPVTLPQSQPPQPDLVASMATLFKAMAPLFQNSNQGNMNMELLNQIQKQTFKENLEVQGQMLAWQRELGNQQTNINQGDPEDDKELAEIAIDLVLSKIGEWTGLDGIGKKIAARRIKKTDEFAELASNPNALKIMVSELDANESVGPDAVNEFLKYLKIERPES